MTHFYVNALPGASAIYQDKGVLHAIFPPVRGVWRRLRFALAMAWWVFKVTGAR